MYPFILAVILITGVSCSVIKQEEILLENFVEQRENVSKPIAFNKTDSVQKNDTDLLHQENQSFYNNIKTIGTEILNYLHVPYIISKINDVPTWLWIMIGILAVMILLCCCCCCPELLCYPFRCAISIVCCPVKCCLSCLGFDVGGPRAGSLASGYQSLCYGGNTPGGSMFSNCQRCAMK